MLRRLLLVMAWLLVAAPTALAQQFEPGWLLLAGSTDTLRGEIANDQWREPPQGLRFRAGAGQAEQPWRARQIQAFSVGGRLWRTETLPLDYAAETRTDLLPRGNAPRIVAEPLLAEVLLSGPLTLWRVVRPGSTHYLVQRPGQPVLDLAERRYLRQQARTGAWLITDGNNYRNQLVLYLADCPAARAAAEAAAYSAPALVAVAQAYNATCTPAAQPGRAEPLSSAGATGSPHPLAPSPMGRGN